MALNNTPPCRCNIVAELLADPRVGLTLTEDGTYNWEKPSFQVLYYCGECNGVMPNLWRTRISDEERERLQEIIESIATADEAIEKLGPPDYDAYPGYWDSSDGKLDFDSIRNVEYYQVSEYANLEFYFDKERGRDGRIVLKFTDDDLREFPPEPEPYEDGTDNGNEPMEATLYETNWVRCPNCRWRFCLDGATHSGEWPVHPKCGQRLAVRSK